MLNRLAANLMITAGALVIHAGAAQAQNFPSKPVRIITNEAGGGNDFVARLITTGITANGTMGQQVIVENRPGASGAIAADTVAKAAPDGYTLLVYSNNFWTLPFIQKVPYDAVHDFSTVSRATTAPNVLVVHPSLPVKTVKDLMVLAKARPGELNYATGGIGSSPHLAAELFNTMAGVKMVHILYKGTSQAITDIMGGHVQLFFATAQGAMPHVRSNRLRAVAVTSSEPSAFFPGLPTVAATLPGFEISSITGVFAPTKTPAAVISRLNLEIARALEREDVKKRVFDIGVIAAGSTPEEFATIQKSDMTRMEKVIKAAGIRVN